jgi:excisionase family DNA binding protein
MGENYPDILTVKELAAYLKMKPVTIYKLSKQGKIPAFRVASSWRYKKELIDKWLAEESNKNLNKKKETP